jgi:hypothetical protein
MTKIKSIKHVSAVFSLVLVVGLLNPTAASAKAVEVCEDGICTVTFSYTGQTEVWYPPKNATTISFQVQGAQGGNSGGFGGEVTGEFTSISGKVFVTVGGEGGFANAAPGGFNGGGASGLGYFLEGSGGGASDIRLSQDITSRIVVAGGGGGRGSGPNATGGAGGGLIGLRGSADGQFGGTGGTQSEGGLGGSASFLAANGAAGQLFFGGEGGSSSADGWGGGGGGGGGYFGGGGGSAAELDPCCTYSSGGGGGSSFTDSNYTKNIAHNQGTVFGDGQVIFSYQMTPAVVSISTPQTFTNSDAAEFEIMFNSPIDNFDVQDIEQKHTKGLCQGLSLSGAGASYKLNLSKCPEGDVWIRVLENSVTAYGVLGPNSDFYSPIVRIDQSAPVIQSLNRAENILTLVFDEEISSLPNSALYFASENPSCQIVRVEQVMPQSFEVEVAGCDGVGYSFTILSKSIQDHAGNLGPAFEANYTFKPEISKDESSRTVSQTPNPEVQTIVDPSNSELLVPDSQAIEVTEPEVRDLELTAPQQFRDQAAQTVVIPKEGAIRDGGFWPIGLVAFAVLAIAAGLFLVRRDLSNLARG